MYGYLVKGLCSLWKESLNSNGQQFHQYQQKEQSSLTSTNSAQKIRPYDVENPAPGLGQACKCGRVNRIMSISTNVQKLEKNGLNSN